MNARMVPGYAPSAGYDDGPGDAGQLRSGAGLHVMIQLAARFLTRYSHINWALGDQAIVSAVNFLTGIFLARFLGLGEFGRYTLAWMAVLFLNSIQHAMINAPMMSIGPQHSDSEAPGYFGAVVVQQICCAGLTFIVLLFGVRASGVFFPEWGVEELALPLACAGLAFQVQDFLRRYFFTRKKAVTAFVNDAVAYLGRLAGLAWLFWWYRSNDIADALWIIAASFAIAIAFGVPSLRDIAWGTRHWVATAKRNWRVARWLVASAVLTWGTGNFFLIAAASLIGAPAVGGYRAAQNIIGITHVMFLGLENAVPPQASRHFFAGGYRALVTYLRKIAWLGGGLTLGAALVIAAAPGFWLNLVFGADFVSYAGVLRWLALCNPIIFFTFLSRVALRTMEETKPIFLAQLLATSFSIVTAFSAVGYFGLYGVVFGALAANLMMQAVLWWAVARRAPAAVG